MPLYHFRCEACLTVKRRILTPEQSKNASETCPECGAGMVRDVKPPTARVVEVLDNGAMSRRVERLADAERLFREHAEKPR